MRIELDWQGDLRFEARKNDLSLLLDGDARDGPSPMVALAISLAGCMAIDVVDILARMRTPAERLHVEIDVERADGQPRRMVAARLRFVVAGEVPEHNVARALELSRQTYCSVWHSLRQDIELDTAFDIGDA